MNEHRRKILDMLAEGKINADEAERLISAIEKSPPPESSAVAARPNLKYLRVVVDAGEGLAGDTMTKVNIRVPLQLLRAGVRLAGLIPTEARAHVNEALREKGIAFDISQLKPENLEELIAQLNDLSVDIDHAKGKARVKIFCE
jgi:polyhydroxyalkanoate synthesis regulator phasin